MKIIYATRLFSGLEKSFLNKIWSPTGVPTIYKVIEEFDSEYDAKFIFCAKDSAAGYQSIWKNKSDDSFYVEGLKNKITVLSGINYFYSWLPRSIAIIFRELRQSLILIFQVLKFKSDIIYIDHANTFSAAILSRYQRNAQVIFRVMGVYPFMRRAINSPSFINNCYKWAYRSPFSLVICTQDGSGVELWLKQAIGQGVKTHILLNGVDQFFLNKKTSTYFDFLPQDKNIILYVGKLEEYKGCYDFVNSIILLLKKGILNLHALIIGTGTEETKLQKLVKDSNFSDNFTFISRLSHYQIMEAHQLSDIYISMNYLGNLSNSNLEAIESSSCMIIPSTQNKDGIDIITKKLLGDSVMTSPIKKPKALSKVIKKLMDSKKKRIEMTELLNDKKKGFLWSWDERILYEKKLLDRLINDDK